MPKVNKPGHSRSNKPKPSKLPTAAATVADVSQQQSTAGAAPLSRGQKKKQAKRQQYEARMVSLDRKSPTSNTARINSNISSRLLSPQ